MKIFGSLISVCGGNLIFPSEAQGFNATTEIASNKNEIRGRYWMAASGIYDGDVTVKFSPTVTDPHYYQITDEDELAGPTSTNYVDCGIQYETKITENYNARGNWSQKAIARVGNVFYGELVTNTDTSNMANLTYTGGYDFDNAKMLSVFAANQGYGGRFDWVFVRNYLNPDMGILIDVPAIAPVSNFPANVTMGFSPCTILFPDLSTGEPTQGNWSFGDNEFATVQNSVHMYNQVGNPTLTATDLSISEMWQRLPGMPWGRLLNCR
jgi:PKD repeat protein